MAIVFISDEINALYDCITSENPWRIRWPRDQIRAMLLEQFSLGLSHGLILTDANAEPIEVNGMTIEVRSLAEWLVQA